MKQQETSIKQYVVTPVVFAGDGGLSNFLNVTTCKIDWQIISQTQENILSDRDRDLVLNLLHNPPEPNSRLSNLLLNAEKKFNDSIK